MSSVDKSSAAETHVHSQPPAANEAPMVAGGDGVYDILQRGKREDLLRRSSLCLRGIALLFSLIGFIVMASNKHGVTIIFTVYTACQVLRQVLKLSDVKDFPHPKTVSLIDFLGDQVMAYMLMSAASSAAVRVTNRRSWEKREDDTFSNSSAAAISMSFLAFFCLALSALISFYKLSTHSYI